MLLLVKVEQQQEQEQRRALACSGPYMHTGSTVKHLQCSAVAAVSRFILVRGMLAPVCLHGQQQGSCCIALHGCSAGTQQQFAQHCIGTAFSNLTGTVYITL